MGEYLIYLGVAVIAFWLGWKIKGFVFLAILSENPDRIMHILQKIKEINGQEQRLGQPIKSNMVEVNVETVNNVTYAYDKATGQFLAQGTSLDEALVSASRRFPHMTFWHDADKQSSQTA